MTADARVLRGTEDGPGSGFDPARALTGDRPGGSSKPVLRPASGLVELLDLERVDRDLFRGVSKDLDSVRVFGGQVIAQALAAAGRTVPPDRPVHSLHAYFVLAGDPRIPIVYRVERTRDGRSFTTRRVAAIQDGEVIFSLSASFHIPEDGPEHQITPLTGTDLGGVPAEGAARRDPYGEGADHDRVMSAFPVDVRWVETGSFDADPRSPRQRNWFRADGDLPDDRLVHACALAYMSDLSLLAAALPPSGLSPLRGEVMMASLDHAMWFHRRFRADEWLLYDNEGPTAGGGRALVRGEMYDLSGRLVASVAQEGLLRRVTGAARPSGGVPGRS
ncbi:acyl-CoA thioesterase [Streptosporangium sp. NPDC002607]